MTTPEILRNRPGVVGATIILRSGRYFDFLNPDIETIDIEDIAWGLAYTCRFGGQCKEFYSVAQHSVLVSESVPRGLRFEALMHDAAEAYIGDMVKPLKQLLPDFKTVEDRVEAAIAIRFGLPRPLHPEIKHADLRLLRTEQRDLTAAAGDSWNGLDAYEPLKHTIRPWSVDVSADAFMDRFRSLTRFRDPPQPAGSW